ncbi:MAG: YvrJ family protein [Tissierellaceae bacterium]
MEEIYSSIANLGFPIVISLYLLVRIEGKLNELTESINELAKAIVTIE